MPGIHRITAITSQLFARWSQRGPLAMERLSSGRRINRAADDAAGLAIAARMSASISSKARGMSNLHDGISLARVAEGALDQSAGMLSRMRELMMQGLNGVLTDQDRATIQQEYDALAAELDRISESTQFNGKQLLDGSLSGSDALVIQNGQAPEVSSTEIDVSDQSSSALAVSGLRVGDVSSLQRLDLAIESVSATRASLGATENRLMSQLSQLGSARESSAAARSRIEDADFAVQMAELIRAGLLYRAQIHLYTP